MERWWKYKKDWSRDQFFVFKKFFKNLLICLALERKEMEKCRTREKKKQFCANIVKNRLARESVLGAWELGY